MTCQEVVEFMQRDLDQDLTEEEAQKLHAHLQKCDDCAHVYHKLTMLSDDLTQLPKVTPPYSLVDRIMPRIEQMERHNEAHSSDVETVSWGKRLTRSLTTRTFGSLAAAAVLLLVIVFTNDAPFTTNNDLQEASMAGDMAEMSSVKDDMVVTLTQENMETYNQSGPKQERAGADHGMMLKSQVFTASSVEELSEDAVEYHYSSPDQAYTAIVKHDAHKYQIIIVSEHGDEVYQSSIIEADELNAVRWSEDGKQVLYEVVHNGAVALSTISVD